jgi:hypothetical protein
MGAEIVRRDRSPRRGRVAFDELACSPDLDAPERPRRLAHDEDAASITSQVREL